MATRRKLLAAGAGAAAVGASGCLAEPTLSDALDREPDESAPVQCPDNDDLVCAEGDPLDVYENFDDDEDVRANEDGTVDFQVGTGSGGPVYKTVPFEEWGEFKCPSVGGNAAIDRTFAKYGNGPEEWPEGLLMADVSDELDPGGKRAANFVVYAGDGDGPTDPIDLDEFVRTAPAYAETTLEIADREYECTVPVYIAPIEEWSEDENGSG